MAEDQPPPRGSAPGGAPADTGRSVRLAHVSDLHVGAEDGATAASSLIADLRAAQVDATIVTGDLTTRARTREFTRAKELLDEFPPRTMAVIGNHDVPLLNPIRRLTGPYDKFQELVSAELDPVLDLPGVRIRGLASMPRWRWKSGRVSERQADLVCSTFANIRPGVVRVVALHHPPSSHGLERLAGQGRFERALIDAAVDVVLAGHTHVPQVRPLHLLSGGRHRTVIEVVAGTATSLRTRGMTRSWSLVELTADTLTVTEHLAEEAGWQPGPSRSWPLETDRRRAGG